MDSTPPSASSTENTGSTPAPRGKQRQPLPQLRAATPARQQGLVDKIEAGSLRAAINLKCWDCTCFQLAEIRYCTVTACALHSVRPYQPAGRGEADAA